MQHGKGFMFSCGVEVRLTAFRRHTEEILFGLNAACAAHAFSDGVPDTFVLHIDQQSTTAAMGGLDAGIGISGDVTLDYFDDQIGELLATSVDTAGRTNGVDLQDRNSTLRDRDLLRQILLCPDVDTEVGFLRSGLVRCEVFLEPFPEKEPVRFAVSIT